VKSAHEKPTIEFPNPRPIVEKLRVGAEKPIPGKQDPSPYHAKSKI
jgi:hypothetical protein